MNLVKQFRLIYLSLIFVGVPPGLAVATEGNAVTRLVVDDVMVHPGKPAKLHARLFQDGPLGGISLVGETVHFKVQGQKVGMAVTGKDGRASIDFTSNMRGNQAIHAGVEPSPKVPQAEGVGNFASWERRRPLLLVELETVFIQPDALQHLVSTDSLSQNLKTLGLPEEQAPYELTKLGAYYYNILYLFRGEAVHHDAIRIWLQDHHFPPGITKIVSPGAGPLLEFIQSIKGQGWDNIEAGIGFSKEFAEVLVKNRITAVVLGPVSPDEKFPRRTKFVTVWEKIRRYL